MNDYRVTFHPNFTEAIKRAAELDEERTKLQTVLEPETFERVRKIVEAQDASKRAAYYGTIRDAVCGGEDFWFEIYKKGGETGGRSDFGWAID